MLLLKATTESLQVTNSVPGLVPTIKGYTYINQAVGTAFTISPDQTISTGDWMIMVLETYSTVTWTDPTGWTVIQSSTLAGTLVTAIYAKIRVAGETSYTLSMPAYDNASTLTLMWGSGAAPIANWVIGTNMLRGNITPATSYNNLAPSITTTSNNNLVLTISSERYTGVTETSIAGMTGAIQWLFKGELNTTEIETICVGYVQQATAGATSNVTITYYYPQAVNGMAIQIGIPPSTGNIDYSVSYDDSLSGSVSMSSNEGKITYPTTSAILAAPAVSTTRLIKLITISNTDPYVNNVVVVQKNINSTTYNVGSIMLLQPGETVQYIDKRGWKHYGSSGVIVADLTLNNSSTGQLQYNSSNVLDNVTNPVAFTITKQYGSGIRSWNFIGMSSDGTHIFAAINNNYISVSADGGVTWTIQSSGLSTEDWTGIVSSADGTHVAAVNFGGPIFTSTNSGVTWTSQAGSGSRNWLTIATSSDGTHLAAAVQNSSIYTSPDSGVTWNVQAGSPSLNWRAIGASSDGTKLVGVGVANFIYTSTDSGVTWTQRATSQNWQAVTSSADGTHLAAAVNPGFIYTSTDSGVTWTQRATSQAWGGISSSSDGTRLVANADPGYIYTSIDSGVTWTKQTSATSQTWGNIVASADGTKFAVNQDYIYTGSMASQLNPTWSTAINSGAQPTLQSNITYSTWTQTAAPSQVWSAIASSSDGSHLVAANTSNGYIYTSTDYGVTWTQQTGSTSQVWSSLASSSDGVNLVASVSSGYIYTSTNSGVAWTQQTASSSQTWKSVACSSDGSNIVAVNSSGTVYTSTNSGVAWTQQTGAPSQTWVVAVSSTDGSNLAIANTSNGYIYTSTNYGVTWTQQTGSPSQTWSAMASSFDGSHLVAANTSNGYIYTSTDYGVTWTQTAAPSQVWSAIASSSDGSHLVAANTSNGYIYTDVISLGYNVALGSPSGLVPVVPLSVARSGVFQASQAFIQQTNSTSINWRVITSSADGTKLAAATASNYIYTSSDSGYTWTQQTSSTSQFWGGITSSADGTKLAATVGGSNIYTSTNSGVTWTPQTGSPSVGWAGITSSSDGTHLAAVVNGGYIYTSTNTGVTWTQQTSTILNWHAIASSADGTKLAAVVYGGYIYTSTNSGVTWTQQTGSTSQNWYTITSSSDGTHLAAVVNGGYIYTSTNTGVTWTPQTNATSQNWYAITSSSDGTKLAAAVGGGYIYTISIPQNETNILALPGGNAKLALQAWNADPNSPPRVVATGAAGSYVSATKTAAVTVPTGVVSGSLIVVFIYATWPNSPTFPAAVTVPTGFYLGGSWPYQDTVYSKYSGTAWYYKYATSTDVGTYNFVLNNDSLGGSPQYGNGYAHIISNGPTSGNPFVDTVLFGDSSTATTSMTVGTFTPGANNSLLLAGVGWDYDGGAGGAILGFPTGWGSIAQDDDTANTVLFGTGYTVQSTAAATGALTFTTNKTSPGNVIVMTIRPTATTSSYALNTNTLSMYARTSAANTTLSVIDPTLATMSLQNALWQNNVISWTPGPSNVGTWMGTSGTNVNSGGGTTLSTLPTTTNVYTAMRRTTIATAVTTTNQQVGLRSELMFMRGATGGQGGFFFSCRFGFDAIATGCRAFVGFTTTTTITSVDSSTLTNILGFGFDVADTAWSFYHNSAAATATKESIPGQGTLATSNTGYDAYIWAPPDSAVVYYRLDRTDTGATIVDSSVSTNLPATTTPLLATAMMSNGTANTAVGAATIGINRLYVETLR